MHHTLTQIRLTIVKRYENARKGKTVKEESPSAHQRMALIQC